MVVVHKQYSSSLAQGQDTCSTALVTRVGVTLTFALGLW
jgi:hypothetical protein